MKLKIALIGVVALAGVIVGKALMLPSKQTAGLSIERPDIPQAAIEHLSQAIQIKTISYEDSSKFDGAEFERFQQFLSRAYPKVEQDLQKEVVNQYSLLYHWPGSNPQLAPYLMLAHLDVVPIEQGTEGDWKHAPFSGKVADGEIWGRGAIDDKANVIAILEAAELLAAGGFKPRRSIYFAFGHDEELNGDFGARKIAELLKSRGVTLEFVSDEGLFILRGSMPGVAEPIAYIGIAEKGYLDVELAVQSRPGHSSMPPKETAVAKLSRAITALSENRFPAKIEGAVRQMFDYVTPEMNFGLRLVFANRWLFNPIISRQLAADPTTDAMIRTSIAPTMLQGSVKPNVLPARPSAVVNLRILPGESIETVVERVRRVIDDPDVIVSVRAGGNNPLPPSNIESPEFDILQRTIRGIYPQVIVAPAMMIGGTDSKHFKDITKNIYRFSPMEMSDEDLAAFHGTNEKIRVDNFKRMVLYYFNLIKQLDGAGVSNK